MEYRLLTEFYHTAMGDTPSLGYVITCSFMKGSSESKSSPNHYMFFKGKKNKKKKKEKDIDSFGKDKTKDDVIKQHKNIHKLLLLFIESELTKLSVWSNPLNTTGSGNPSNFIGNTEKSMASDVSCNDVFEQRMINEYQRMHGKK